jgi:hypothetical protein
MLDKEIASRLMTQKPRSSPPYYGPRPDGLGILRISGPPSGARLGMHPGSATSLFDIIVTKSSL